MSTPRPSAFFASPPLRLARAVQLTQSRMFAAQRRTTLASLFCSRPPYTAKVAQLFLLVADTLAAQRAPLERILYFDARA
eukprot:3267671-Pleurochrysis_carterae.AAC.1